MIYDVNNFFSDSIEHVDPEAYEICVKERNRQKDTINLIASENRVSRAVSDIESFSLFTNKYVEGFPGKRYYQGIENSDAIETLAIERAKKLFGCEYANVQPHSGSQANQAVYLALLKPGDTILGFSLDAGGHLTHGSRVNQSGKWFNAVSYGVDEDSLLIDMSEVERLAIEHKPKIIIAGASAYSRTIDFAAFRDIADKVGAYLLADVAHYSGLIAGGAYPSPIEYADVITTTTHKVLRGPRGGLILTNNGELIKLINRAVFPGMQGGAFMHIIAAKAVAFLEASLPSFKEYATNVIKNAQSLSEVLVSNGVDVCTGGTDTHIILVDLRSLGLKGNFVANKLEETGIVCNKNAIPFDIESPFVTSGLRFGTAAETTRGFTEQDFKLVGELIVKILKNQISVVEAKTQVREMCSRFAFYF
ncbi:serine hydroxymethyltransferase [Anaplasmataceae bacterium AB001_6]|nr:serine hydroxymethyltransferase [Anaplasmataceae bacterium AB001_6]